MAVTDTGGMKLDINAAREQLNKDRDAGRISTRDYKRISKGMNRLVDNERKGISYEFTGDGRFKTASSNGQPVSRLDGGIGVSDKIPLFGRQVSKGMGYLQQQGLNVPVASKEKQSTDATTGTGATPQTKQVVSAPVVSVQGGAVAPIDLFQGVDQPSLSTTVPQKRSAVAVSPGQVKNADQRPNITIPFPDIPYALERPTDEQLEISMYRKKFDDAIRDGVLKGSNPAGMVLPEKSPRPEVKKIENPGIIRRVVNGSLSPFAKYEKWRREQVAKTRRGAGIRKKETPEFAEGGKIRRFSPGGLLLQNTLAGKKYLDAMKSRNPNFGSDQKMISLKAPTLRDMAFNKMSIQRPSSVVPGDRITKKSNTNVIPLAKNENAKPFDKDSAINTAMGLYGAASLLTAKRPKLERPNRFNMAIRPAMGDEDMVSRSMNSIDESVRGGAGDLRARTGNDLTSYVQGLSAMTDNATRAKSDVLGTNAQIKRQDENRMFSEMNREKELNLNLDEGYRREKNILNESIYNGRVQGAQAAVNNSLNYGVHKRADEANNNVNLKMANRRMEFLIQAEISKMKNEGKTPQEIKNFEDGIRSAMTKQIFAQGGRIESAANMSIANNKNMADANKELRRIFNEYKKLVAMASLESLRQFNANIRSVNQRNNLTITRR